VSPPAARLAALEEWIRLGRDFLLSQKPATELSSDALAALLRRRDALLGEIQSGGELDKAEADAVLRLQVLEAELLRRVEQDLERRRRELDELDQTRRALRGYAEEREGTVAKPARFIDTKS
jgi:hypothetical protein